MARVKPGLTHKLAHLWHGPFRILKKSDDFRNQLKIQGADYHFYPWVHVQRREVGEEDVKLQATEVVPGGVEGIRRSRVGHRQQAELRLPDLRVRKRGREREPVYEPCSLPMRNQPNCNPARGNYSTGSGPCMYLYICITHEERRRKQRNTPETKLYRILGDIPDPISLRKRKQRRRRSKRMYW